MTEGAEPAKAINLSAVVTPTNGNAFTLNSTTQVLSDAAVTALIFSPGD